MGKLSLIISFIIDEFQYLFTMRFGLVKIDVFTNFRVAEFDESTTFLWLVKWAFNLLM